jgi:hypothetical protein
MIPVGILASAAGMAPVAPLRTKVDVGGSLSSGVTVTFDEGTPLSSSHLLVAIVSATSNAVPTTPAGWTLVASGGGTARRVAIFARQANGSVNSVTVTAGGGIAAITLLAFSGYNGLTALASGNGAPASNSFPVTLSAAPAASRGVVLAGIVASSTGAIGAWSNGWTELVEATSAPRATHAWRVNDGTTAASTVTVTGSTSGGWAAVALPLL